MEGLGAEVSAKIRSAIKAKLIELEAYVDEELPDYIMVMVANNRNKEQMEEDLGLFLNNNTKAFTNWLHAVLEKLKKVTLEEVSKKDTKKKKVKKSSEKSSSKKSSKEEKKSSSRAEKKSSKSGRSSDKGKSSSSHNANLEQLGERKRKKTSSHSLDDSGGKDGYNPASMLKGALDKSKSKDSPKKSSSKKSSKKESESGEKKKSKNIINLREEEDFYRNKKDDFDFKKRGEGGRVSSMVSKVVKPVTRDNRDRDRGGRRRSRSISPRGYDPERALKRSLVSVPARPSREAGREERGVARAVSRAMVDADRSIVRGRREERDVKRYQPSPDRDRERLPRLTDEDLMRYEFLKRRREERDDLESRQRERDLRDRHKEDQVRLAKKEDRRLRQYEDDEDLRIVVRRDKEEDYQPEASPPKKRKLDDDDAELLEMRRKALESLMKRTDEQLLRRESQERKIIEEASDQSDSDSDSDTSVSEVDTSQDNEPTFIVTMDGIDDNYFRGAPQPKDDRRQNRPLELKSLSRRKAESLADSKASSDAELELHADISFDDIPKEKPKKKVHKVEVEKPTMKVAARKRSPIVPPSNGDASSQPVAAVKPLQAAKASAKGGSAAKLAASYAAKLSAIKANKAKEAKKKVASVEEEPKAEAETDEEHKKEEVKQVPVVKKEVQAAPKMFPTAPVQNKTVAGTKRKPISAPSPDRSSMTGVSKLSYPNTAPANGATGNGTVCKFWPKCARGDSCIYSHPPVATPTSFPITKTITNSAADKYKWKAGNKIVY